MNLLDRVFNGAIPEPNSGCWLWMGATYRSGRAHEYGVFSFRGKRTSVHRASYIAAHGEIPPGLVCRHCCDVSLCVNPDHLVIGTQGDNVRDMFERCREHQQNDPGIGIRAALEANATMAADPSLRARGDRHGKHGGGDKGEANSQAKLTDADVAEIKSRAGENQRELAREFGTHQAGIWRILHNKRWQHVRARSALEASHD